MTQRKSIVSVLWPALLVCAAGCLGPLPDSLSRTDDDALTASGTWKSEGIANQTGTFEVDFDASASVSNANIVMGLSNGSATAYASLAAIVRFNNLNMIDARAGGVYAAASSIPYTPGVIYHFRLVVTTGSARYDAFVTAPGKSEIAVGQALAFRSEMVTASMLNSLTTYNAFGGVNITNMSLAAVEDNSTTIGTTTTAGTTTTGTTTTGTTTTGCSGMRSLGQPGISNTGPCDVSLLEPSDSITVTQDGAVIQNVDVTGTITVNANNVTIKNFRLNGNSTSQGDTESGTNCIAVNGSVSNLILQDGEITACSMAAVNGGNFTAERLYIHDMGGHGFMVKSDITVSDSYVTRICINGYPHKSGSTVPTQYHCDPFFLATSGPHDITIKHNNVDIPWYYTLDNIIYNVGVSACVFDGTQAGASGVVLVDQNWLNGGSYALTNDTGHMNFQVTNNIFAAGEIYGLMNGAAATVWSGNTWNAPGQSKDGQPANAGDSLPACTDDNTCE